MISIANGQLNCDGSVLDQMSPIDFTMREGAIRISFKLNDRGKVVGLLHRTANEVLHYYKMN